MGLGLGQPGLQCFPGEEASVLHLQRDLDREEPWAWSKTFLRSVEMLHLSKGFLWFPQETRHLF